jgi:hypothetical protein
MTIMVNNDDGSEEEKDDEENYKEKKIEEQSILQDIQVKIVVIMSYDVK